MVQEHKPDLRLLIMQDDKHWLFLLFDKSHGENESMNVILWCMAYDLKVFGLNTKSRNFKLGDQSSPFPAF